MASKKVKTDGQLLKAALEGGPEEFGAIVERYQDAVFGIALARLRDFHEAEDIAQQVFVAAFERLDTLAEPSRLGPWLRSVTIHRCIDRLRGRRETVAADGSLMQSRDQEPPTEVENRELREQVLAAIGRLSKTQRETTTLFYINGYSVAEVAGMQEVPAGTVKRRLHDAREKLKEELMGMVEDVLKFEAPKEDFGKQVYEILCQHYSAGESPERRLGWSQSIAALRRIGGKGMEGFIQALESRHSPTRIFAMHMLNRKAAPQNNEVVVELLKKGLADPNRKVRRFAVEALLCGDFAAERKRRGFVPLVIPLISDPSRRVRRAAAYELVDYWAAVPSEPVVKALLAEEDFETRKRLKMLLHAFAHKGEWKFYVQ